MRTTKPKTKVCTGCRRRRRLTSFAGKTHVQPCKWCKRERQNEPTANVAHRERCKRGHQLRRYGITAERYAAMFEAQCGLCALCHEPEKARNNGDGEVRRLAVDHDHETGVVRSLLCSRCNAGLGNFDDDPAALRAAADYLEAHRDS